MLWSQSGRPSRAEATIEKRSLSNKPMALCCYDGEGMRKMTACYSGRCIVIIARYGRRGMRHKLARPWDCSYRMAS